MVIARSGLLLPGPLSDWLREQLGHAGSEEQLALELGSSVRQLEKYLEAQLTREESGLPRVETVDRILTRAGASMAELYGPLYELPIPEPDWCRKRRQRACQQCGAHLREPAELCGFCEEEARACV